MRSVKEFNTARPCDPALDYMLPAEERLPEARRIIDRGRYFVVYAPQQTGKTTTLAALARQLTTEGRYAALHFSCEAAEPFGDDIAGVEKAVLDNIRDAAQTRLPPELRPPDPWPPATPGFRLTKALTAWTIQCPRPLVLFFDEIDALRGASLISVLRQLRGGYTVNRSAFPHSVVLCGLRDVREYKAASGGDPTRLGTASPFNIKVASLRLGDFTAEEVAELYGQHTAETGQEFAPEAIQRAFGYTQGQPWLVNALANEIIEEMGVEPPTRITVEHVDQAKERLILARATHLDSLAARLHEPRVQRIIEPMIAGTEPELDLTYNDDVAYLRDLGLVGPGRPVAVANPIYKEVIVRILGAGIQEVVRADPRDFVLPDGRLDFRLMLERFAGFWVENGEFFAGTMGYPETAPQVVLMAFLQRIVNGGGYIDREYGAGRGRIDLLVRHPYTDTDGKHRLQREALELKVRREKSPDPLAQGLVQLDGYLDRLSMDTGVLVIFDTRPTAAPLPERLAFSETTAPSGRTITLLRV